jgi:hypothetical protein|tara:strand:+ start:877 stop:1113 length:237 start_codon:yes stop_codon:yes gene_type:complete
MGTIKVNAIEKHDNNQIALNSPIQFKSYTTTQRDALSSPQAGWTIYNSTTNKLNQYNGSAWTEVGGGASIGTVLALGE